MSHPEVDRRTLLAWVAALTAGGAIPGLLNSQSAVATAFVDGLEDVELEALRNLSEAYIDNYGDEDGVEQMVAKLRAADLSEESLLEELKTAMREDFLGGTEDGAVVRLYGWFVSRTEARVVAAAARLVSDAEG